MPNKQKALALGAALVLAGTAALFTSHYTKAKHHKVGLELNAVLALTTRNGDNQRSGIYQTTYITVSSLQQKGVHLVTTVPLCCDARGTEAQPLIFPQVTMPQDNKVHDVMFTASLSNNLRAVDAHTGAGLWQTQLEDYGEAVKSGPAIDMHGINDHFGVLSTPVGDPDTGVLYVVAEESPDGSPQKGIHYLYTIDAKTGKPTQPPLSFANLEANGVKYTDAMRKQRASLMLINVPGIGKRVVGAYGTVLETGKGAAGAVFGYNPESNSWDAFLPMSAGRGAGIWMGGDGLAAYPNSDKMYAVTGNGSYNGITDWGEAIVQLVYTPGKIQVYNGISPYSDSARVGLNPVLSDPVLGAGQANKLAGVSAPSAAMKADVAEKAEPVGAGGMKINWKETFTKYSKKKNGEVVPLVYPTKPTDPAWSDEDLGSGGVTLLRNGELFTSGKDGIGYLVDTNNMTTTKPSDFANMKQNCDKFKALPFWAMYDPGPVDPCPQDVTSLNFMPWGKTRHGHMTAVQGYIDGSTQLYMWGENSPLQVWSIDKNGQPSYLASSREIASVLSTTNPGGMPGGMCSMSTNQFAKGTSVLWCSIPLGDANANIVGGRLLAYNADPASFTHDKDGVHVPVLWDSQRWGISYVYNKFMPPEIWENEVILPNYNGGVMIFAQ